MFVSVKSELHICHELRVFVQSCAFEGHLMVFLGECGRWQWFSCLNIPALAFFTLSF